MKLMSEFIQVKINVTEIKEEPIWKLFMLHYKIYNTEF